MLIIYRSYHLPLILGHTSIYTMSILTDYSGQAPRPISCQARNSRVARLRIRPRVRKESFLASRTHSSRLFAKAGPTSLASGKSKQHRTRKVRPGMRVQTLMCWRVLRTCVAVQAGMHQSRALISQSNLSCLAGRASVPGCRREFLRHISGASVLEALRTGADLPEAEVAARQN